LLWPLLCTFMLTIGELYLSPIGLSLVTKVSPKRIVSMMMGLWLGSSFLGNIASGQIGRLYGVWSDQSFFLLLTALGIGTGFAMWAFNAPLKKVIGNV
jgi:POT family proton-dependent oligopeptide transporter